MKTNYFKTSIQIIALAVLFTLFVKTGKGVFASFKHAIKAEHHKSNPNEYFNLLKK